MKEPDYEVACSRMTLSQMTGRIYPKATMRAMAAAGLVPYYPVLSRSNQNAKPKNNP